MAQVEKTHYRFEKYAGPARFASYWYQLREILHIEPASMLEVGVGDGVVGDYVRRHTEITYTSADYAGDVKPDVVADVRALPFPDGTFELVCAFEVLEHLPFDDFEKAVSELARVSKRYLILSLPHFGPPLRLLLKIPFLSEIRFAFKIPVPLEHFFNGEHYWEIGKRGYPASRIRAVLRRFGALERDFVPFENQYHHFFILRKAGTH